MAGATPHVFVHTPDNVDAPELAIQVWNELRALSGSELPEITALAPVDPTALQLDL
ncbi:MAG: hypothetical protein R2710_23540 [Acidimicrobiales bacterium]